MFISFGMFIGLIIVTIIMIILIIYLTFTGGNKQSRHKNVHQAEQAAKERLAQNNQVMSNQSNDLNQNDLSYQDNFKQESHSDNQYYQEPDSNETTEEDYSLHILPYPKDDEFK
ncbi:hypothetical protein A5821_000539 [Enterococcus sp. 7F3_DIV0205]|uniref:Uncharacterized protein n=1 Tax=Candidatus Enterococcus palustris TaxID=1834189 RepID=A0AAQ3W6L4_9ENTE|nr:hypothetical protein [Enterococcus sp. 7F3_DIV0205]OTN84952.1 hypothetical protein A5821_000881 [Enterococcus sp. 7F3_DIV0205]